MAEIYADDYASLQVFHEVSRDRSDPPKGYQDPAHPEADDSGGLVPLAERVRAYEVGLIREALARTGGNQSEAARLLGVPRRTLAHKVLTYGIARSRRAVRERDDSAD